MSGTGGRVTKALVTLGAVAGLVGYAYVIGGAAMMLRMSRAHLPARFVVESTANTALLVQGVIVLVIALVVAAIAAAATALAYSLRNELRGPTAAGFLAILAGGAAVANLLLPFTVAALGGLFLLYALATWRVEVHGVDPPWAGTRSPLLRPSRRRQRVLALAYVPLTILATGLVAYTLSLDLPDRLHPVQVDLSDSRCVAGLFVTSNATELLIATNARREATRDPALEEDLHLLAVQRSSISDVRVASGTRDATNVKAISSKNCPASLGAASVRPAGAGDGQVQTQTSERGPPGERGPRGEDGPRGERGLDGERGPRGERGLRGEAGAVGEEGRTGKQGPRGVRGAMGPHGPRGESGPRGPRGRRGPPGKSLPDTR